MVMVRTPAASLNSSELMSTVPAATLMFPPPVKRQLVVAPLVIVPALVTSVYPVYATTLPDPSRDAQSPPMVAHPPMIPLVFVSGVLIAPPAVVNAAAEPACRVIAPATVSGPAPTLVVKL